MNISQQAICKPSLHALFRPFSFNIFDYNSNKIEARNVITQSLLDIVAAFGFIILFMILAYYYTPPLYIWGVISLLCCLLTSKIFIDIRRLKHAKNWLRCIAH